VLHGKAKVSYLDFIASDENVGRLQITVNDAPGLHVVVAVDHLVHQGNCLTLRKAFPAGDELGKVASIAKLSYIVSVVLCVVDIVDFEDVVAVLERLEDFYFGSKQVFVDLVIDLFHVYHLNRHHLI